MLNVWLGLCNVEVVPSPKSQVHDTGPPVEVSVNATTNGAVPDDGVVVNDAVGVTTGEVTVTVTVELDVP